MKTLSNLFMNDFIDLCCGKLDVLLGEGEKVGKLELSSYAKEVIFEYNMIVNSAQAKSSIIQRKDDVARLAKCNIFKICSAMLDYGDIEGVKEILSILGYGVGGDLNMISSRVKSELRRLEFERKRLEAHWENRSKDSGVESIRKSFDRELAFIMSYFKMQIDIRTVTASVYANLVAQAQRELKAKRQMLNNMKR